MPPLENPRWEKFAQALFQGETADAAYAEAGYKPNDGNCIRLKGNERVNARLAELQAAVAKKAEVTVESLLDELEHARQRADSLDQLSAVVKATSEKAKISGLLTQKIEIGAPGDFKHDETNEEIANAIIEDYKTDRVFSEEDEREAVFFHHEGTRPQRMGTSSRFASRSITASIVVVGQMLYRAGKFRSGVAGTLSRYSATISRQVSRLVKRPHIRAPLYAEFPGKRSG